ncbi:TolC family protein [Prochlorococcus sp. MIT 1307]|uniref:TolC family protein n=1 Tax=Prochlorococcus sp. MIT 1307 TaxID=3096219 RepID=UPI002A765729|nr:TolC family protein [Prochlorococcus sp. MIT 1307]
MRGNTAKIVFVVCVLLQGTNSIKAAQSQSTSFVKKTVEHPFYGKSLNSTTFLNSNWPLKKADTNKRLPNIKATNSRKPLTKSKTVLPSDLLFNLTSPDNLSLPRKTSEIEKRNLYPLEITDLEKLVEANNPKLEVYRRQIEQQKYNLKQSISTWYPTIDLGATPQYLDGNNYNDARPNTSSDQWKTSLSVDINWNLIDPSRAPEINAAKDTYEKAKASYLIELRDLKLEALNAYFLLQKSDAGVRIGKESVRASQLSLSDAKARFDSGLGTRLEVLEAETQLARDNRLLTNNLGEQSINRSSLAIILNLPLSIIPVAATPPEIIGVWESSLEESIISAYSFREELENIRLDISINNSNANAALASVQPKLSIFNTFNNSYTEGKLSSINSDGSASSNTVGLKATWRVFDGLNAQSRYNYNKEIVKVSEAKFAEKRNNIRQEIEQSFIKLRTASKDIMSSTREVIAARESLRLARLRFQSGITTQREVVNNQRDLTQAEVEYTEAITAYNTSIAKLQRSTGVEHVQACTSPKIMSNIVEDSDPSNIPIDPFPVIKACPKSNSSK